MPASQWIETANIPVEFDRNIFQSGSGFSASWRDLSLPLPLPEAQVTALRDITERMSTTCSKTPVGIIAVFTGCDAAGKLMAAEALAYEMRRPLCRVDGSEISWLSAAEIENHFIEILHAASAENAILILDNADGLPTTLLKQLESYPGLSILTTDSPGVVRRLAHYIVDFPFPLDNE